MGKLKNKYIFREIIKRAVKINGFLLRSIMPLRNEYDIKGKIQPVYIIGCPRTGSSILYQILTQKLDVLYLDNLADVLHPNLLLGMSLSKKFFDNKPHNCFSSVEGDTWACGLHAPSESGDFWYQYLPKDRHFIDYADFNEKHVRDFQRQIFSVIQKFEKPFLFKNLNAGQRMRLLSKVSPDAKFIYVKRDFHGTAFSILNSRNRLGKSNSDWWSIKPKDYNDLFGENVYELIVNQMFYLGKQIAEDASLFGKKNIISVDYKDLYENYDNTLNRLKEFIGAELRTGRVKEPELKQRAGKVRDNKEEEMFLKYYEKYNWDETEIK